MQELWSVFAYSNGFERLVVSQICYPLPEMLLSDMLNKFDICGWCEASQEIPEKTQVFAGRLDSGTCPALAKDAHSVKKYIHTY